MDAQVTLVLRCDQAMLVRQLLRNEELALLNHIASAVESGDAQYGGTSQTGTEYARSLVAKLQEHRAVLAQVRRTMREVTGSYDGP